MQTQSVDDRYRIGVALAGLAGLALAMGIGRFSYTAILPMMQADQGLSLSDGNWLALANLLGYLIGGLTAARFRHRAVYGVRLAIALIVATMALMALTDQLLLWSLLRLVTGIASAWAMVTISILCLPRLATQPAQPAQPSLAAWVFSGVGSGIAMSGIVCLVLVVSGFGSAVAWMLLALLCAALGSIVWRRFPLSSSTVPNDTASEPAISAAQATTESRESQQRLWKLVICYGLYGFGYILPATYLPAQARLLLQEHWVYSMAWPVFGVAAALSTLLAAAVAYRFGRLPTWVGAHLLMAAGVVLPVFFPNLLAIMLAAVAVGGTFVVITLLAMQEAQQHGAQQAPVWMVRLTTAFAMGQLFGPLFVMWLGEQLSLSLLMAAGVLLVSAVVLYRQWRQDDRTILVAR
jgi:MFS family permease